MKPLVLLFVIAFFINSIDAQTSIQINIKNSSNYNISKAEAFDLSQQEFYELAFTPTVNFSFKKDHIDCYNINFHVNGKLLRQQIWLDAGQIKIEAHIDADKLIFDTVINSPIYYEFTQFKRDYSSLYQKKDTAGLNRLLLDLCSRNLDNLFSLQLADTYLMLNQNNPSELSKLKQLMERQGDKFSWFLLYAPVNERLKNVATTRSVNLSEFTFINSQNQPVAIELADKQFYILDFWFLDCAPCVRDHKEIYRQMKTLEAKHVAIISISTDSDVKRWQKYLTSNKYNWQHYLQDKTKELTKSLNIFGFPAYYIINQSGNILTSQNSFSDVMAWLDKR